MFSSVSPSVCSGSQPQGTVCTSGWSRQQSPGASGKSVMGECLAIHTYSLPTAVCSHHVPPPRAGLKNHWTRNSGAEINLPSLWDYYIHDCFDMVFIYAKNLCSSLRCDSYVRTLVDYAIHVLLASKVAFGWVLGQRAGPAGIIFGDHEARAGLCVASFILGKINKKMTLEVEFFIFLLSLKRKSQ